MADIKESPPLFDTNETKVDDLDDDDEDIFASAVQVLVTLLSNICTYVLKFYNLSITFRNSFVFVLN